MYRRAVYVRVFFHVQNLSSWGTLFNLYKSKTGPHCQACISSGRVVKLGRGFAFLVVAGHHVCFEMLNIGRLDTFKFRDHVAYRSSNSTNII